MVELRDRLQPLLISHVDSCLADIPGMPKDIAGLIVEHLHLPYDVANFKNLSQDDMNKLRRSGASPNVALEKNNSKNTTSCETSAPQQEQVKTRQERKARQDRTGACYDFG